MVIGQLLWEGTGKTQIMIVKGINADGVTVEFTWSGEIKGIGKASEIDGTITFTGTKIAPYYGGGKGPTAGNGILFTPKDMIAIKSSGYGNPKWNTNRSLEIWSFSTASKTIEWLNDTIAIVTQEGDPAWKEFKIKINEWIPTE